MTPAVTVQHGDWLELAAQIPRATVDFLYADPPFNTGSSKRTPPGAARAGRDVQAEYRDSWPTNAAYVRWVEARMVATKPALKRSGVVALHCDQRASHLLRVMLDGIFGEAGFVNHLVWSYGLGGSSPRRFSRKHDDILVYALDPETYYFEAPRVPATSRRMAGQMKKATDVIDIPAINNMAAERTGYPTQKPVALLELLVSAFCPPSGTVLDPCCGSGTTLVAAAGLGRSGIGFDVSPAAVELVRKRAGLITGPRNRRSGADQ